MKIFTKPTTTLGWVWLVAAVVVALLVASWVAGQIRDGCHGPVKVLPVVPGHVDQGTPVAGPVAEAPTVPIGLVIAVPDLTPEEVAAFAKKYGLTLLKDAPKPGRREAQGQPPTPGATPAPPSSQPVTEPPVTSGVLYPIPLAEERFSFKGIPGVEIDVSAAQLEPGGRVILTGVWLPYAPPPVIPEKMSYFGNTAKWERFAMLGYVGQIIRHSDGTTETKADPGIGLGLAFHSWRIGKANLDARAVALVTQNGGAAIGGVGVSWK